MEKDVYQENLTRMRDRVIFRFVPGMTVTVKNHIVMNQEYTFIKVKAMPSYFEQDEHVLRNGQQALTIAVITLGERHWVFLLGSEVLGWTEEIEGLSITDR